MARYTYSLELSQQGIKRLQKELQDYKTTLRRKLQMFVQRMAEEGVAIAQLKVSEKDAIYTGELHDSIRAEAGTILKNSATWYVFTGCPWAKYVEFGTGIVGSQNPHPNTSIIGWKYDINEHGENGWFYWRDGAWHWTKGMPSRPFMFETAQQLQMAMTVARIAKEVFG